MVVSLGSEESAYDDGVAWVGREVALLRDAVRADVPVLGICFGSQILARALGGEALRAQQPEIGWVEVSSQEPGLVAEGPWFEWHYDTFRPPAGAVLLAESPAGPQAYTVGRSLGVQFHPEVTNGIVEEWVSLGRDRLVRDGVDPEGLLEETRRREAENRARTWRLMDAFVDRVASIA
jgi:GMP synthase-like glutamine amidotransferase